jgi:hypothetical protein
MATVSLRCQAARKRDGLQVCVKHLYPHLRSGYWEDATPKDFATLYGWCHKRVWGSWPCWYDLEQLWHAARAISRTIRNEFAGDNYQMALYIRWIWTAEKRQKESGTISSSKLHPTKLFFGGGRLLEFRKELARQAKKVQEDLQRSLSRMSSNEP